MPQRNILDFPKLEENQFAPLAHAAIKDGIFEPSSIALLRAGMFSSLLTKEGTRILTGMEIYQIYSTPVLNARPIFATELTDPDRVLAGVDPQALARALELGEFVEKEEATLTALTDIWMNNEHVIFLRPGILLSPEDRKQRARQLQEEFGISLLDIPV